MFVFSGKTSCWSLIDGHQGEISKASIRWRFNCWWKKWYIDWCTKKSTRESENLAMYWFLYRRRIDVVKGNVVFFIIIELTDMWIKYIELVLCVFRNLWRWVADLLFNTCNIENRLVVFVIEIDSVSHIYN